MSVNSAGFKLLFSAYINTTDDDHIYYNQKTTRLISPWMNPEALRRFLGNLNESPIIPVVYYPADERQSVDVLAGNFDCRVFLSCGALYFSPRKARNFPRAVANATVGKVSPPRMSSQKSFPPLITNNSQTVRPSMRALQIIALGRPMWETMPLSALKSFI